MISPRARLVASAAAALIGLAGCGGSSSSTATNLPNGDPNIGPPPRLVFPKRPRAVEDVAVDYASLPKLEPMPVAPGAKGPSFTKRADGVYDLHMPDNLLAEIMVGSSVFFAVPIDGAGGDAPAPGGPGVYAPVSAGAQLCEGGLTTPTKVVWIGFDPKSKSAASIDFVRYEGMFDPQTCSAKVTKGWHAKAPAILAGALYAFRASGALASPIAPASAVQQGDAQPSPPDAPDVEKLEVIGPRSIWLGSTASTDGQHVPLAQPFARVVVPVLRGSTATAVLDVSGDDLKAFQGSPGAALADAKVVSFTFDLVWPQADSLPSAVAYMSALPGVPEQLVPPPEARTDYAINIDE